MPSLRFFSGPFMTVIAAHRLALLGSFAVGGALVPVLPTQAALSLSLLAQTSPAKITEIPLRSAAPVEVIEDLHMTLLEIMQNAQALGWQGRYDRLYSTLIRAYNFNDMARIAAGSYWKTFTEAQKASVVEAFSRMSIATYASRFDTYGGERFETVAIEDLPQSNLGMANSGIPNPDVMVQTRLVKADGAEIKLSYRLAAAEEGWKIVDVFYRGTVSELANQRAQYVTVLSQSGYNGLLQRLDEKVKKLATGQKSSADAPSKDTPGSNASQRGVTESIKRLVTI